MTSRQFSAMLELMSRQQQKGFSQQGTLLLIAGIVIIFGIGWYVFGIRNKQSIYPFFPSPIYSQVSPTSSSLITNADKQVQDFYNWYFACQQLVNTADAFHGGTLNPEQVCAYNKTGVLTSDLANKLQQVVAFDPVLCAQNTPQKVTFEKAAVTTNGTASVIVHTIWGTSSPRNIHVGLQKIDNQWKIVTIDCNH